jgi:hypothetical protein
VPDTRGRSPGHPRLASIAARKTWMAGTEPGHDELTGYNEATQ